MDQITNSDLTEKDVPPTDAKYWGVIDRFALSFDGYTYWGSFDKCGEIANGALEGWKDNGTLPDSLSQLRTCLFFEQRRWRHFDRHPDSSTMAYIRALLDAIRTKVKNGEIS